MTKARNLADNALSTVSPTELGYLDGVTSAIQTQVDGKQAINANVSTTELGYLDGVTSAIQTQIDAKTAKATLTTTGDIYYASGVSTPARLGIGSSAQVLTVASGVPSWATPSSGSMTLLATTTLTGATVTVSSIDQTYQNLYIVVHNFLPASDTRLLSIRLNGASSGYLNYSANQDDATANQDSAQIGSNSDNSVATKSVIISNIYNYTNTTTVKLITTNSISSHATTTTNFNTNTQQSFLNSTSAITSITYRSTSGDMTSGTAYLYGVK